jgi:hypothetical protein
MRICDACHHRKKHTCGLCGCVLKAKTASPEETCPELRWGAMKFDTPKEDFVYIPQKEPKSLDEHIKFAQERGEKYCLTMPLSELDCEDLFAKGFSIKKVRNKQRANCREGCVDNYDVISWG